MINRLSDIVNETEVNLNQIVHIPKGDILAVLDNIVSKTKHTLTDIVNKRGIAGSI